MVSNQTWDSVDPKDTQIMVLYMEVVALKSRQGGYNGFKEDKGDNALARRNDSLSVLHPWYKVNVGAKIFKNSV